MSHKPPTFASSPDPLDADDWLKSVEKMLNIAQCTDREKVLYASGRLTGPAADWWDSYTATHDAYRCHNRGVPSYQVNEALMRDITDGEG